MRNIYELTFTARNFVDGEFEEDFDVTYTMAWTFDTHEESLAFAETVTPEEILELEREGNTNAVDQYTAVYTFNDDGEYESPFDIIDEYIWVGDKKIEG